MGTDSSPLESHWWNRVSFRKLKMGAIIVLCVPFHLIFLFLYLGSPALCSEQSCECSGTVTRDLWLWEQPQSWLCGGTCRWRCLMGQAPILLKEFFCFVALILKQYLYQVLVRIYQCQNSRFRQYSFLNEYDVNLLVIFKTAVAMPTRGPVKNLWVI